jgi:hypothetical protein
MPDRFRSVGFPALPCGRRQYLKMEFPWWSLTRRRCQQYTGLIGESKKFPSWDSETSMELQSAARTLRSVDLRHPSRTGPAPKNVGLMRRISGLISPTLGVEFQKLPRRRFSVLPGAVRKMPPP